MVTVTLRQVRKTFCSRLNMTGRAGVDDISITLPPGSITALVGPNGAGKTTVLRLLARLTNPDSGEVTITPESPRPNIGLVPQDARASLFPWLRLRENVELPLQIRGMSRDAADAAVQRVLRILELNFPADRYPHQASGGEIQAAAVVRALVPAPALVILDEPFASFDFLARRRVRVGFLRWWQRHRATTIVTTHDPREAAGIAHKIVVLSRSGRVSAEFASQIPAEYAPSLPIQFPDLEEKVLRAYDA